MIKLYNPTTGAFVANPGSTLSAGELNILIELRVLTALLMAQGRGTTTDELEQLRSDAVNDSANPVI